MVLIAWPDLRVSPNRLSWVPRESLDWEDRRKKLKQTYPKLYSIMKKTIFKNALLIGAIASLGLSAAVAVPQVTMRTFDAGSGGNYRANPNSELDWVISNYALGKSTDGIWFGTFCIEKNEYFSNGGTYDVELNNGSIQGGVGGAVNGKDIISVGTAHLYEQFALGTLSGFTYGDSNSALQLQNTIWYLEDEFTNPNPPVDFGSFLTLAQSVTNYADNYNGSAVKVMNLTRNGGQSFHQDQLVYTGVSDSGATLGLLALGLFGLGAARRRFGKS